MEWIKGYEGLYKINRQGEIWSSYKKDFRILDLNTKGYHQICLRKNKHNNTMLVHRLLAIQYIPNPENKPLVDHINRTPLDNRLENLRWSTAVENMNNIGKFKSNTSGESNINFEDNAYRVHITYNKKKASKRFESMSEAIVWRNKTQTELKNNTYITPRRNKTGHTGITFTNFNTFRSSFNYNKKSYQKCFKTLEEAIAWREETIASMKAGTS